MPIPQTENLRVDKRTDFSKVFDLLDSAGAAFNLTGYTTTALAKDRTATVLGATLDLVPTVTGSASDGKITMNVADAVLTALTGVTEGLRDDEKPIYDLLITKTSDSTTTKVAEGFLDVVDTQTTGT